MELKFYYKGKDSHKIKKDIESLYNEVKEYFDFDLDEFSIYVCKTRKKYDKELNKKTELWDVANTNNQKNRICILHPEAFKKESNHPKSDFPLTLKHELTHLFIAKLSQKKAAPKWLNEGTAYYIAEQYSKTFEYNYYIEENFCEKLATPRGWKSFLGYGAYSISALFVYYLIETFSFDKVKDLFVSLDKHYYYPSFKENFEKVFGKSIEDMERDFVKYINEK